MFAPHDRSDPINVLEALYALEQPRPEWFQGVLAAASPVFDRGAGIGFVLYNASGDVPRVEMVEGINVDPKSVEINAKFHAAPEYAKRIVNAYRTEVCSTMAEHVPEPWMLREMREVFAKVGVRDQILVNGGNPSGFGCALYVFSKRTLRLAAPDRLLLTRIATHLSTAYRLHRRLEAGRGKDAPIDAVLKVDGRVEHVESPASSRQIRATLSEAVKQREWARGPRGRSNSQRATAAWKPLVVGRWTLVDAYEHNGSRYITARENAPSSMGPQSLSSRERQVTGLASLGHSNKLIAYELGIAHSTVRVLLARAAAKLGVRSRAALLERVRADVPPSF
jgi:DNA-binding CsgD family transcriptional regulator